MGTELQINQASPLAMATEFLKKDSGIDVEKLSRLLEVQERWEKNEAKKAYHEAMAAFKANPPKIAKDRHVKYSTSKGTTEYNHASLENVTSTINKALSEHGLTASWVTEQKDNEVTVKCKITHIFGHSEETSLSSAPDNSGGKNSIQAIGSAVSYLQRYTLLALTGLATEGQDDDGLGGRSDMSCDDEVFNHFVIYAQEVAGDSRMINVGKLKNLCIQKFKRLPADDADAKKIVKWFKEKNMINSVLEAA